MPKTFSVRWDDFEAAFIIGSPDARYFVNTSTGEVEYTSHLDGETVRTRVLGRTSGDDWLEISRASTPEGMVEIEEFISSEDDADFAAQLRTSLEGRRGLITFNRTLGTRPEARKRWSELRMRAIRRRCLAFCREHDLEIDDDAYRAVVAELG